MSLELRKGTWFWRERRVVMTFFRVDSDLLMCCVFRRRLFSVFDLFTRFESVRFIRFSLFVGRV